MNVDWEGMYESQAGTNHCHENRTNLFVGTLEVELKVKFPLVNIYPCPQDQSASIQK